MKWDHAEVGDALQARRKAIGLTQEQMAEKIGISQNFYARIEAGTSGMSIETLMSICSVLLITPNDILIPGEKPASLTDNADIDWIIRTMKRCTEKQRSSIVDIIKAYYRSL